MKWISIYHRMPMPYLAVLVVYSSKMQRVSYCVREDSGKLKWANESRISVVTHWMPLPAPPENEAKLTGDQALQIIGDERISREELLNVLKDTRKM